ncbi:hypothetical protein [Phenylobacterium sp.]|jgi:hypothetical protein|uniref:hypothetical protein n=1 Tax=Phenylobacterium sp. TaxID=1871053 RepID=UPI002F3F0230
MAVTAELDHVQLVISTAVDAAFYREIYPELARLGVDPVAHYADAGWREGRDPAPWFSTLAYLTINDDVARAGMNPLQHYLLSGRLEGREIARSPHATAYLAEALRRGEDPAWRPTLTPPAARRLAMPPAALTAAERAAVAAEFDAAYYLGANADVAEAGSDPLGHFLASGWREGRDPSTAFSIADYLEVYPDIAAAGINPFLHFIFTGRAEGRLPRQNLGFRYRLIADLVAIEARVARVAAASRGVALEDPARLADAFAASRAGWTDLHLSVSHDDYMANMGGLQICLQREAARIAAMGRDHLHVFPAKPWPTVRAEGEPGPTGVVWNGETLGVFAAEAVVAAVAAAASAAAPGARSFAIHSLLGHAADEVADLALAAGMKAGFFWLHDFASLCAGYHLLRNDVADCGAPPPDSAACGICVYQPMRARHVDQHRRLFERLALTVVAPSAPTLATWRGRGSFPAAGEIIHPHARLVPRTGCGLPPPPGPFRFAFLGLPAAHKGWPIFRALALKYADDPRYQFLHLGMRTEGGLPVAFHPVTVTDEAPAAMPAAVEGLGVDAAMIWPLCRETFSFTAYEAVAGGAAVVTSPDSGNVAAFVEGEGHGRVLPDEAALDKAFATGEILALARARRRPQLYDLAFSGVTADLVVGTAP